MPEVPKIEFELGWRNIIDIDLQQTIISKIHELYDKQNPKIAIAIEWLARYIAFRPAELIALQERHVNVSGFFVVPSPKEDKPKLIAMLDEDIELVKSFPPALPNLPFFRHTATKGYTRPGDPFGKGFLYKVWKKACGKLDVEGVDLYGGTRHSTATALGEYFSETEIMKAGSMHKTNKAARRYIQDQKNDSIKIYRKVNELQKPKANVIKIEDKTKKFS